MATVSNARDQSEAITRTVRKATFAPATLAEYARTILAEGGPRAIRVREISAAKPASIVFVARHEDAKAVLLDEDRFSLRPYGIQFQAIAPKGGYLLMREPGPERDLRYGILRAAAAREIWTAGTPDALRRISREAVEAQIAQVTSQAAGSFDLVSEYAFLVTSKVAHRVFGLPGAGQFDLLAAAFCWIKGTKVTAATRPDLNQQIWSQLILGQLFGNFELRQHHITLLAGMAISRFHAHVLRQLATAKSPVVPLDQSAGRDAGAPRSTNIDGSLLAALLNVRPHFSHLSQDEFEQHVILLMVELVGTLLLIPGIAFCKIVEHFFAQARLPQALALLDLQNPEPFIEEALRLAQPTEQLMRVATCETSLGGVTIAAGEYVCVLVGAAGHDPRAFVSCQTFSLERDLRLYLNFGPFGGPHRCFGRAVAVAMLSELLAGLRQLPGLAPHGKVKSFAGVPERMTVTFSAGNARELGP
jgi:cytochrome P450